MKICENVSLVLNTESKQLYAYIQENTGIFKMFTFLNKN